MSDLNHEVIMRGDIYYVHKGVCAGSEQYGGRPGIVVSNEKNNQYSDTIEVVYLTTKMKHPMPTHVEILSTTRKSTALCEQVHTVSVDRIGQYIGHASKGEMVAINAALLHSLGLSASDDKQSEEMHRESQNMGGCSGMDSECKKELEMYKRLYEDIIDRLIRSNCSSV